MNELIICIRVERVLLVKRIIAEQRRPSHKTQNQKNIGLKRQTKINKWQARYNWTQRLCCAICEMHIQAN